MRVNREKRPGPFRKVEEFFWNIIGGSLVVAMLAGVFYSVIAIYQSKFKGVDQYWNQQYFIYWFVGLLLFYVCLPRLFAACVGGAIATATDRKFR